MADYILIIGEKDQERFRRFRTGYDRDIIKSIGGFETDRIWALGPSINSDMWSSIQKDDKIFFAENGMPFRHYGIVHKKITDQQAAIKIWGDSPRMREHNHLVFFSDVYDINMNFHKLCHDGGISPSNMSTYLYILKNKIILHDSSKKEIVGIIIVSDDGAPNKKDEVVTRFIRDTKKVTKLKELYQNKCQICDYAIQISPESRYSEVHHIHPLKDGGDDDFDNMLVLCPTHHVEFDYKIIGINGDKKTIIDKNGNKIGILTIDNEHKLNDKNIQFHLTGMNAS